MKPFILALLLLGACTACQPDEHQIMPAAAHSSVRLEVKPIASPPILVDYLFWPPQSPNYSVVCFYAKAVNGSIPVVFPLTVYLNGAYLGQIQEQYAGHAKGPLYDTQPIKPHQRLITTLPTPVGPVHYRVSITDNTGKNVEYNPSVTAYPSDRSNFNIYPHVTGWQ